MLFYTLLELTLIVLPAASAAFCQALRTVSGSRRNHRRHMPGYFAVRRACAARVRLCISFGTAGAADYPVEPRAHSALLFAGGFALGWYIARGGAPSARVDTALFIGTLITTPALRYYLPRANLEESRA